MSFIRIDTNAAEVSGFMRRLFADQIPFATSKAINETAKDFQKLQRRHQRRVFEVRRPRFVDRAVKIKPFASKRRLFAEVRIEPPGGQKRADILTKFETQRRKRPREGGSRIAIPVKARRTGTGVVSKTERPRALEFKPHGSGGRVFKGKKRTFMIRQEGGEGFIFKRLGRGSRGRLRLLFTFKPSVPIDPELDFLDNARRTVRNRFALNFGKAFDRAVRTAR